jgi:Rrf2 family protein
MVTDTPVLAVRRYDKGSAPVTGLMTDELSVSALCYGSVRCMAANTRFATGVHILVLLAAEPDTLKTSTNLAEHLKTNPVVVRRVLSSLQRAELILSQKGPTGGSRLAKSAKVISLADIYKAVESNPLFYAPVTSNGNGARVNSALDKTFIAAKKCVIEELSRTTLAQMVKRVAKPGAKK